MYNTKNVPDTLDRYTIIERVSQGEYIFRGSYKSIILAQEAYEGFNNAWIVDSNELNPVQ